MKTDGKNSIGVKIRAFVFKNKPVAVLFAALALLIGLLSFGGYRYSRLGKEFEAVKTDFSSTTKAFETKVAELENSLSLSMDENERITAAFLAEKGRNDYFDAQIKGIESAVGVLDKLAKTDKELLQKYSKVYFLNEHYAPETLTDISSSEYAYKNGKTVSIHTKVWPYLQALLSRASSDGVTLQILSGYRSFGEQSSLKESYKVTYGSGANQFSADQGYSEHQLGTAVDFTTPAAGSVLQQFKKDDPAFVWLTNNSYKYGFVLSYPEKNAFYIFEPWHWRFFGVELATKLHEEGKYFYDMEQREIDSYLVSLFD